MDSPKISVIMPAYNHEKYIGEAIESVLNQSFEDFEFVIINDGSTDRTDEVIRSYGDRRIKYYVQENMDAFNALNRGLSLAKGRYIAILNSDDVYHRERLSFLCDAIERHKACFLITNVSLINETSDPLEDPSNIFVTWLNRLLSVYDQTRSLEQTFLLGNIAVTTSNFFFSSDVMKEIGVFKPFRYSHDYEYALRAFFKYQDKFLYFRKIQYLSYRIHDNNTIIKNITEVNKEGLIILLNIIPELISGKENKDNAKMLLKSLKEIYTLIFHQLDEKEIIIQNMEKIIQDEKIIIQDMINSRSWKITSPLRRTVNLISKIKNIR